MATTKKTSTKKAPAKKAATKKVKEKKAPAKAAEAGSLDRKDLAAKARQLKTELLAIRFNLQPTGLKEYRLKRLELAKTLGQLA